jgi:hypothetical protein
VHTANHSIDARQLSHDRAEPRAGLLDIYAAVLAQ